MNKIQSILSILKNTDKYQEDQFDNHLLGIRQDILVLSKKIDQLAAIINEQLTRARVSNDTTPLPYSDVQPKNNQDDLSKALNIANALKAQLESNDLKISHSLNVELINLTNK